MTITTRSRGIAVQWLKISRTAAKRWRSTVEPNEINTAAKVSFWKNAEVRLSPTVERSQEVRHSEHSCAGSFFLGYIIIFFLSKDVGIYVGIGRMDDVTGSHFRLHQYGA